MNMPQGHTFIRIKNHITGMLDDNKGSVVWRAGVTETKCHAVTICNVVPCLGLRTVIQFKMDELYYITAHCKEKPSSRSAKV
jgi:hypothetical protein